MKHKVFKLAAVLLIVLISGISSCFSQEKKSASKEVSFTMDNDFFMFQGQDGYYTNGLYLQYSKLAKKQKAGLVKKINSYGLNQMIFNAFTRKIYPNVYSGYPGGPGFIDRPITGYLFVNYKQSLFHARDYLVQWGVSGGTIGKASFGQQVQTGWHKETGVGNYWNWAWDYQLKSDVGLNIQGLYATALLKKNASFIQITPVTNFSLGSIFTNINQSVLIQLGRFNRMSNSSLWNSRLQSDNKPATKKTEFFFYYQPQLLYQVYNATVQGGLLRKDRGPFTSAPVPFVFTHQIGISVATRKYTVGLNAFYEGKEAESQKYTHPYGRVNVAVRF